MSESDELIRNWERNNDTLEKLKSVAYSKEIVFLEVLQFSL